MNVWENLAKSLGLELEDEFIVCMPGFSDSVRFKFTETGMWYLDNRGIFRTLKDSPYPSIMYIIMEDPKLIVKKRWRPRSSDVYFYMDYDEEITHSTWYGTSIDRALWSVGNCFRTYHECLRKGHLVCKKIDDEFYERPEYLGEKGE